MLCAIDLYLSTLPTLQGDHIINCLDYLGIRKYLSKGHILTSHWRL